MAVGPFATSLRALSLSLLRSFLVQNAESFLQCLDFLLTLCNPLFIGHAGVDACWLQLNDFLDSLVQEALFLREACVVFINGGFYFCQLSFLGALGHLLSAEGDLGGSLKLHE